mmetsp:Transcript_31207/g.41296  ORF Transcript_31207/g.41296 Transcript_31207/m.41296 type:complete len:180 (+) Transcript_31207:73-612(+)
MAAENEVIRLKRMKKAYKKSVDLSSEALTESQIFKNIVEACSTNDVNSPVKPSDIDQIKQDHIIKLQAVFQEVTEKYDINQHLARAEVDATKGTQPQLRVLEEGVGPQDVIRHRLVQAKKRQLEQLKELLQKQEETNKALAEEASLKQKDIIKHVIEMEKHKEELQQLVKLFPKGGLQK